ncbi:MAG: tRNA (adenosine(37)-N6)-threonylcarbamoyltransferase complex dimerization subunit type 1 TsaB [Clostridia bacterium]|nr:tRNA (adenosine(37)-N6)-threonylcarbamoyltransferase complex dimerization subunit type 1 TsaB [Clostridia bacterium]
MKLLCMDTAGKACSVALLEDENLISELYLNNGFTHSVNLLKLIDGCFSLSGMEKEEIGIVGITSGPGSFTGLRIGMSTAKAFAQATGARIETVSTLDMLVRSAGTHKRICAIMDARQERVYGTFREAGRVILENGIYGIEEMLEKVSAHTGEEVVFTGDGCIRYADRIGENGNFRCLGREAVFGRASAIAPLALEQYSNGISFNAYDSKLDYYMPSQAERNRK